jgi:hypothetical protein
MEDVPVYAMLAALCSSFMMKKIPSALASCFVIAATLPLSGSTATRVCDSSQVRMPEYVLYGSLRRHYPRMLYAQRLSACVSLENIILPEFEACDVGIYREFLVSIQNCTENRIR